VTSWANHCDETVRSTVTALKIWACGATLGGPRLIFDANPVGQQREVESADIAKRLVGSTAELLASSNVTIAEATQGFASQSTVCVCHYRDFSHFLDFSSPWAY
jgi:hypothetical protein